jgi:hypothetical protein
MRYTRRENIYKNAIVLKMKPYSIDLRKKIVEVWKKEKISLRKRNCSQQKAGLVENR